MPAKAVRKAALLAALTFFLAPAFPQKKALQIQTKKIPQINSTKTGDKDFMLKQFDDELLQNRQLYSKGEPVAPAFYAYTAGEDDKLLDLAARFCLRYDSFCPLNGIYGADADIKGRRLAFRRWTDFLFRLRQTKIPTRLKFYCKKIAPTYWKTRAFCAIMSTEKFTFFFRAKNSRRRSARFSWTPLCACRLKIIEFPAATAKGTTLLEAEKFNSTGASTWPFPKAPPSLRAKAEQFWERGKTESTESGFKLTTAGE